MTPGNATLAGPMVESLLRREREILALLAQSYASPEIAKQRSIALSSVRSHPKNLYGKLGVNRRRRPLLRAQELGLLGRPTIAVTAPPPDAPPTAQHNLPGWLDRPDQAAIAEAVAQGQAMDVDQALAYALGDAA